MTKKNCFIEITNKDIYQKLINIEAGQNKLNKKVAICFWISSTALTMSLFIMGFLLKP